MWFRKYLVAIRQRMMEDEMGHYMKCLIGFLVFAIGATALDILVPFEDWWMVARSALLIPLAFFAFSGLYAYSCAVGRRRLLNDSDWMPYRARWSPKWRRNLSFILGAFIVVIVYALQPFPGYTVLSSFVVTIVVAMVAFCRLTRNESRRSEMGVPDPRDTNFDARMKKLKEERERKRKEKFESDEDITDKQAKDRTVYEDDDERVVQSHEAEIINNQR